MSRSCTYETEAMKQLTKQVPQDSEILWVSG